MKNAIGILSALAFAATLGALAGCGTGDGAKSAGDVPSAAAESTARPAEQSRTTATESTATEAGSSKEVTATDPEQAEPASSITFQVWFAVGEGLGPVERRQAATERVGTAALEQLLAGPTAAERIRGYATAIPSGTRLLGLAIGGGVATVDLSSEFESGGQSDSMRARLGQVTCTLTQFPTVDGVRFKLDGRPVDVFARGGVIVDHPVRCGDYEDVLPPIDVANPRDGQRIESPIRVGGTANVFEANVTVYILDERGRKIAETFTTATCGTGCRGQFMVDVPFEVDREQRGTVVVHDDDAAGVGRPPHEVRIPVILAP